ncbi:carbohydrate ABC transporter permease [Lacrimispora sp.]|uniref:carbohydrate ABC transporter permease n=1 Tax=Lacrimispora sp. TaxID=2719234 RepID=UPI003461543C
MNLSVENRRRIAKAVFYTGNTIIALIFVSPLLWMIASSLKPESELFSNLNSIKTFIPKGASLNNYKEVFQRVPMLQYIGNSIFYVTIIVIFDLIINSLCGYALAKLNFKGKGVLISVIISLMVLPTEAIMLPLYKVVSTFGWINHWQALIVPFVSKCFSIYMFRQFFLEIPDELIEAAAIDGCSPFRTFVNVVVPISGNVYATVFILDYVSHWNDFMWPMLAVTGSDKRTIQLGIQTFFGLKPINYGPIMAALAISALPMVMMFLFLQKYYVQGISTTGIKG